MLLFSAELSAVELAATVVSLLSFVLTIVVVFFLPNVTMDFNSHVVDVVQRVSDFADILLVLIFVKL